jgi:hypothetical protein
MADYTDLVARLRFYANPLNREAADALEVQARRIAELEAALIAVYRHMDMDGTEIDCCDLQGTLIKHGILVAYTATEPCGDCCTCAEYGPEFPMTCYRLNDDLRAARAALEKKND